MSGECKTDPACALADGEDEIELDGISAPPADPADLIAASGSTFGSEERDNVIEGVVIDDKHVKEQTHRVLMFLNSLIIDEDAEGPNLRIVEILKKSFEVLRRHCPNRYVPEIFSDQVLKAFLFLVREGDLASLRDVSEDDHANIMGVLNQCSEEEPAPKVKFNGRECPRRGIVSAGPWEPFKELFRLSEPAFLLCRIFDVLTRRRFIAFSTVCFSF